MTNKEAITWLREIKEKFTGNCTIDTLVPISRCDIQAIDLAIKALRERPQGKCKTCKHYQPYYEQFSNKPRGDGFCRIVRMAYEGATTINCHDEFGCSDYEKGEENGN